MKSAKYTDFIPENIAPYEAKKIRLYSADRNKKIFEFGLQNLTLPNLGEKMYSFLAISDVHILESKYPTATADFQRALTYAEDTDCAFTCICGDLTDDGSAEQLSNYKAIVDEYALTKPVYAMAGNHDTRSGLLESIATYTGHPFYYSFEQGDDVFIFVGCNTCISGAHANYPTFTTEELQWLYETLEANRNKRCFLFQHVRPDDACGNILGIYKYDIWNGVETVAFENLLKHYKNIIHFHGHSHLKFYLQEHIDEYGGLANYDKVFGVHSIHLPSLAVPRDASDLVTEFYDYAASEGHVVDVYKNHIVLRGRDFVKGEFMPIATYCIDTTLQTVEAGTFTDSTGTITT